MPSAALVLAGLRAGVPVQVIVTDTRCARSQVVRLAHGHGMLIDPDTDVATVPPSDDDIFARDTPLGKVRAWARERGIAVATHGRIRADIVAAYEAAEHGD